VSFPALRGRCRTCGAGVGLRVYAWELGGAAIAVAIALPVAIVTRV
jgi:Bacterial Peptidase A24 N-terminal domain